MTQPSGQTRRLKITVTCEYDADIAYYNSDSPGDMARQDEENFQDRMTALGFLMGEDNVKIIVRPVIQVAGMQP